MLETTEHGPELRPTQGCFQQPLNPKLVGEGPLPNSISKTVQCSIWTIRTYLTLWTCIPHDSTV